MPRPRARGRVAAGVYWNARRESYYLRFRATVYDDQVDRIPRPARRVGLRRRRKRLCGLSATAATLGWV